MKIFFTAAATLALTCPAFAQAPSKAPQACWLETASATMPAAMGGAGLVDTKVWNSTVSGVLVRNPKGDVLIDTGYGPNAEAQMDELPPAGRAFGLQVVSRDRKPITHELETVGEPPASVARIIITHAHYDHMGGAGELTSPVYVAAAEAQWMADQAVHPTIVPPSLVASVKGRLKTITYDSGPYLGFGESQDVYGDGTIVVVPLPGRTPGSLGVFVKLGERSIFLIGDAADTLEAAERGLPKNEMIRTNADFEPSTADDTTRRVATFHRAHPEIAVVPAHDRPAYTASFGAPSTCVTSFHSTLEGQHAR